MEGRQAEAVVPVKCIFSEADLAQFQRSQVTPCCCCSVSVALYMALNEEKESMQWTTERLCCDRIVLFMCCVVVWCYCLLEQGYTELVAFVRMCNDAVIGKPISATTTEGSPVSSTFYLR